MKITERKKGEWIVDFTLNGKRNRRVIEGTRKMAEQAATLEKERIYRHKYRISEPKKRIRIEAYMKIYTDQYEFPRSLDNLETHSKTLLSYFKGKFLDEITPGDIEKYNKRKKEVSEGYINNELSTLKAIFQKAIDSEDYGLNRNPVKKVDFFKVKSKKERVATDREREGMLQAAKSSSSDTLYVFLVIAFNTGMRKMEILSLEWKNVDFSKRMITVPKERAKSGRSREIPMNDIVADELIKRDKTNRYVFYNPKTGTYIRNIKTAFWKACENAKVKNFRVHDLRHSAASCMVNDCGIDIKTAAEILGHSDITMTAKYIHPTSEHKRLAVDRLGEIFKKGRKKVDTRTESVIVERPSLPHMRAH